MSQSRLTASPRLISLAVAFAIYLAIYVFWLHVRPFGEFALTAFDDVASTVAALLAGALGLYGAATAKGRSRAAWALIGLGCTSWGLGQTAWTVYEVVLRQDTPFPSIADVGYLGLIPPVFVGLLLLASSARSFISVRTGLDAVTLVLAVAAVVWHFLLGPIYAQSATGLLGKALTGAYPLGDLVAFFGLVVAINHHRRGSSGVVLTTFSVGLTLFLAADLGFSYLSLKDSYSTGSAIDYGWFGGFLIMAFAGALQAHWQPDYVSEESPRAAAAWRQGLPLALLLLVFTALFGLGHSQELSHDVPFLIMVGFVVLAVAVRQAIVLSDNVGLNHKLYEANAQLELRVRERTEQLSAFAQLTKALTAAQTVPDVLAAAGNSFRQLVPKVEIYHLHSRGDAPSTLRKAVTQRQHGGLIPKRMWLKPRTMVDETGELALVSLGSPKPIAVLKLMADRRLDATEVRSIEAFAAETEIALNNALLYEQARSQAERDSLTGIYNHRYFQAAVGGRLEQEPSEERAPFSLVLMDVDNFKLFNDTYGHPRGDEVLKNIAKILLKKVGEIGLAARYGGDEFAALLQGDKGVAVRFAQAVRRGLDRMTVRAEGTVIPIRMSYGIATYPEDGLTRHGLLVAADTNLYDSKRHGGVIVDGSLGSENGTRAIGNFGLLNSLMTAIEQRDHYTKTHCELAAEYGVRLARAIGLSEENLKAVALAGLLHDVGKIGVPDEILRKPGPLTGEEYELMKQHPSLAPGIIHNVPHQKDVLDAVVHHHERFDGTGYPEGLQGEQIPLLGRLLAVVDAYSAMILDRPYRKAMPLDEVIDELRRAAGTQLDPRIAAVFVKMLEREAIPKAKAA